MEFDEQTKAHLKANSHNPKFQEFEKQKQVEDEKGLIIVKPNYNVISEISRVNYVDDNFVFPPGYRFCPHDEELIIHYLKKRVMNERLPHDKIKEVNLYKYSPQELSENYSMLGDKEWYFFTPRDRKYPNGNRPNRAAGTGYWKATGADKPIKHNDVKVGFRKALVFYEGKPPKGDKTNWIMHEFRVNESRRLKTHAEDMRLDDWVLCRIYKKVDKSFKNARKEHEQEDASISCSSIGKMENYDYEGTTDSIGKMENYDYEGTTDSYEIARQNLKLPLHYDITFDDSGFNMDYNKYNLGNFSHYGPRSNYGMPLQPSFSPGNIFWDQKVYQENCNSMPMNFDVNNFYQDSYDEIQSQNILDSVLDENPSIYKD